MAIKTYTPLLSEVLDRVHKAKTKAQKIKVLQENDTEALRMIIKSSFDPKIKWAMPEGAVPYKPNDAPDGTEHTLLAQESKRLWHFIEGADNQTPRAQKENMYIQMLEGLHRDEAEVLVYAKDKILHQKYKGLSHEVVKTAFGWNSDYVRLDSAS
jgi:hypothetical protein|tara:strand:+ start:2390 stop:2854 length:465 start_codon:yes stop_codon:yes gene_type:complete